MDSLRQAVGELREWRAEHEGILQALGFSSGPPALKSQSPKATKGTNSDTASSVGGDAAMDVDGDANPGQILKEPVKKMTLQHLSGCIHAAEKIAAGRSLKEVREMRAVVQRANDWIEQCQSLCPRRQSKRRVQPSSKPTFDRLKQLIAEGLASPVGVSDEVGRIRKHIAEAESCQHSARSVLEKVCVALAEQTVERKEIWRKESKEEEKGGLEDAKSTRLSSASDGGTDASKQGPSQASVEDTKPGGRTGNRQEQGNDMGKDNDSADDESDGVDREDELDDQEETSEASLEKLLVTARDITVFMPEELVAEKVQKIMEWAR